MLNFCHDLVMQLVETTNIYQSFVTWLKETRNDGGVVQNLAVCKYHPN